MKLTASIVLILMLCFGCKKPTETKVAEKPSIESIAIPQEIKPSLADAEFPTSVNAFVTKFHELYSKDPLSPFIELCAWGDLSNEDRVTYIKAARQDFWSSTTGKMRYFKSVNNIRPEPTELTAANKADGYMSGFPLTLYTEDMSEKLFPQPTHMLEIQSHIDPSTSIYTYLYIGEHEGKFYICTVK